MTIEETIRRDRQQRLARLQELEAPEILLATMQAMIDNIPTTRGMPEYGQLEVLAEREAYGPRSGKYRIFRTASGEFAFFPGRGARLKPYEPEKKP